MKLCSSFKKELILAMRSFYFYIDLFFAVALLAVLLFAVPEHAKTMETRYICLDLPEQAAEKLTESLLEDDLDGKLETAELNVGGKKEPAGLVEKEEERIYILGSEEAVRTLADTERNVGAVVSLGSDNKLHYRYYLQGYESARLKNLISVLHNIDAPELEESYDSEEVRVIAEGGALLNDRQNALPPLVAFNSCLMGMFIMAAYVFLDKKEGVIKAYAVTASPVSQYLMSKTLLILLTATVSGLIVTMPVMGFKINYALLLLLLITAGFFSSVLGLLIASFYRDIVKAFGMIFLILVLMMLPAISYFIPGWNPAWVKPIPSYPMIQALKETVSAEGPGYTLFASAGFLAAGLILFAVTDIRFKKSLGM